MNPNIKGALFALLAFAIFSTHDVIVKFLGVSFSPFQIVFFSVLFGFPWVSLMLVRDAEPGNLRPRHPWWTLVRTIATTFNGFCVFYAFSVLPLAQTYAILFSAPLLITILSIPILGETVRLRRWVAVIVGLCGVIVVLRPGATEYSLGHLAALVGAVGSALASIIVRKIGQDERNVVLLLFPMLANFAVMGLLMPFVYQPMGLDALGGLALMSLLALIAGMLMIMAYKTAEAVIVAPMQYSQILWATLFGLLFFDETPDIGTAIGAAVIIGSGLYIVLRESRADASANTPVLRTRSRVETGTSLRLGPLIRMRNRNKQ